MDYEHIIKGKVGEDLVRELSKLKNEEKWILDFRLRGLKAFNKLKIPNWMPKIDLDFDGIFYAKPKDYWNEIPEEIKKIYEKLKLPEFEFGGFATQYDSEIILKKIREELKKLGVIFVDPSEGLKYEIFKKWFSKLIPPEDNKFAALNSAFFSGGSFIYVPPNIKIPYPIETFFRLNIESINQFERTLIIADKNSEITYIEGCTAPLYLKSSLHAGVVEIVALEGAKVRYITLQNWSKNVYNLVTKRAIAFKNATIEWIDANLGSKVNVKYPSVILKGENSKVDMLSVGFVDKDQIFDVGGKAIHLAPNTSSKIISKSVVNGGVSNFRSWVKVNKKADNSKSFVRCDSLILKDSKSNTYPYYFVENDNSSVNHEAYVGRIGEEELNYLMSRGLSEEKAISLIVNGFFRDFTKKIPLEYAVEFKRLLELELGEGIG